MSNDQNKAGTNPTSNKPVAPAPAQLIMPSARRSATALAGKSAKALPKQTDKDPLLAADDPRQLDMMLAQEGGVERSQASADAAMSVRRGSADEDLADLEKLARLGEGEEAVHQDAIQLAQASTAGDATGATGSTGAGAAAPAADAPVSVGEELLRQAAPLPRAPQPATSPDWLESWFGKDWKLPVAIGGGALALLGLAAGGGGGSNGGSNGNSGAEGGRDNPASPAASTAWTLTVTPAAGPFIQGATVRATVQKLVNGSWQEVGASAVVDRNGRMTIKIDKSAITEQDTLRLMLVDTDGGADHRDEIAGAQSLGAAPLLAIIGSVSSDQQVTVNPLTTLAANKIGQDLSAANVAAVHAAVAQAFGISSSDLAHLQPGLLGLAASANLSVDSKNYGLALGIISGMAQAQRDAGQPPEQALAKTLELLATAFATGKDGKVSLDLAQVRQAEVVRDSDNQSVAVGLDEGAVRLYKAATDRDSTISGVQVPYVKVDASEVAASETPAGIDTSISLASFADGLSLNVSPAASAKAGDKLTIEFVPLGADGKVSKTDKTFTYDYLLTEADLERVAANGPANGGVGSFTVVVPTFTGNKLLGQQTPAGSAADSSVHLVKVGDDNRYQFDGSSTSFQLRASGSALGFLSGGPRISVSTNQVNIEAKSASVTDPHAFNASSTVTFTVVLSKEIYWDKGSPILKVNVAGNSDPIEVPIADTNRTANGDVLTFRMVLSQVDGKYKGLEGRLSLSDDAIVFPTDTVITDRAGRTLLSFQSGSWKRSDGTATTIEDALGVKTRTETKFRIDTKPPSDPILNLQRSPDFDALGFFNEDLVPDINSLNAGNRALNGSSDHSAVTSKINQDFVVSFDAGKFNDADRSARVNLYATLVLSPGKGTSDTSGVSSVERRVATTNIVMVDGKPTAVFNSGIFDKTKNPTGSYIQEEIDALLNRLGNSKNANDENGVIIRYTAVVVDGADNTSVKERGGLLKFTDDKGNAGGGFVNQIWLDTRVPGEPKTIRLASGSDQGRDADGKTRSDGITSSAQPTLEVEAPIGHLVRVWGDSAATQLLGKAWVPADANGVASVQLSARGNGRHTVYTTVTDQAGNQGASKSFDFEVLKPYAGQFALAITSQPPSNGYYREGDVIEVTVSIGDRAFLLKQNQKTDQLFVELSADNAAGAGGEMIALRAAYASGIGTGSLKFVYKVQAGSEINASANGFKAASFSDPGRVLEDVTGSPIQIAPAKVQPSEQMVRIDTQAPVIPELGLSGADAFTAAIAKNGGLKITTAETDSTVTLSFSNKDLSKTLLKTVKVTQANQPIKLEDADLLAIGDGRIEVSATSTDIAGNTSAKAAPLKFSLDTVAPTATATSDKVDSADQPTRAVNRVVKFNVVFNEPLRTDPTVDSFDATNGTVDSVTKLSGASASYTVTVTPNQHVAQGNRVELRIKTGSTTALTDVAGNPVETGKVIGFQAIDTQGPQIVKVDGRSDVPVKNGDIEFVVHFDEMGAADIIGVVGKGNFGATNGTVKSVQQVGTDQLAYKVVVQPAAALTGDRNDVTLQFFATPRGAGAGAFIADDLGNIAEDQSNVATQVVDVAAPTIQSSSAAPWSCAQRLPKPCVRMRASRSSSIAVPTCRSSVMPVIRPCW